MTYCFIFQVAARSCGLSDVRAVEYDAISSDCDDSRTYIPKQTDAGGIYWEFGGDFYTKEYEKHYSWWVQFNLSGSNEVPVDTVPWVLCSLVPHWPLGEQIKFPGGNEVRVDTVSRVQCPLLPHWPLGDEIKSPGGQWDKGAHSTRRTVSTLDLLVPGRSN